MKSKIHDALDDGQSIFAAASGRRHRSFSKTNAFADISKGIAQGARGGCNPVGVDPDTGGHPG